ncbi:hypothetical protein [Actinoplanes sp. NPDC049599]|uniref:hypothetical protein n=1 Tax=Actinoplanes sp. NPDC049599 TaxID=3363903 RepID=UPI0037AE8B97
MTSAVAPRTQQAAVFVLGRRWRRATLILHIIAGGAWIGIDVMVAVLVGTGRFATDPELRALAYRALAAFVVWPMLTSGLVCLATGLVLGLCTKWGLLRYWWVAVKLALNLVLCTLIVVALEPGMDAVAAYGRGLTTGGEAPNEISSLFFPPAVSLTALTIATVLGVLKPWGRIRRRRPAAAIGPRQREEAP